MIDIEQQRKRIAEAIKLLVSHDAYTRNILGELLDDHEKALAEIERLRKDRDWKEDWPVSVNGDTFGEKGDD